MDPRETMTPRAETSGPHNGAEPAPLGLGAGVTYKMAPLSVSFVVLRLDEEKNVTATIPFNAVQITYPFGANLDEAVKTAEAQAQSVWERGQSG